MKRKTHSAILVALLFLLLGACGEGGVDGTGIESEDLILFQECFARSTDGDCGGADFNGDGYINYLDLAKMKESHRYDLNRDGYVDTTDNENNQDIAQLSSCEGATTEHCEDADFNNDGTIDNSDITLLRSSARFDLNDDGLVDVRGLQNIEVARSQDLEILLNCLFKMPQGACATTDLNADQRVDFADTEAFREATRFDLNGDGIIDFHNDDPSQLVNTSSNEDLKIIRDCFFVDTRNEPQCEIADFTGDNIVNAQDLGQFVAARKFDLDLNEFVDLRITIESMDLNHIRACLFQAATGDCTNTDLNSDSWVNTADLGLFRASKKYDLNHDDVVDLHGNSTNSDLTILQNCFFVGTVECNVADFNGDMVVNALDLAEFSQATKYDFNQDGFIDLRLIDSLAPQDLSIMRSCFLREALDDCIITDLNNDGIVNVVDLGELRASLRYDLSGDNIINLNNNENNTDLAILRDCFSANVQVQTQCIAADFNEDGFINAQDLALFQSASKYDFNLDLFVDLRD